jgi:hypothetical protein
MRCPPRTAGRATIVAALSFPIAARLVREATNRRLTLGEAIEDALVEGWLVAKDRGDAAQEPGGGELGPLDPGM